MRKTRTQPGLASASVLAAAALALHVVPAGAQNAPCRVCVAAVTVPTAGSVAERSRPDAVLSGVEQGALRRTLTLLGLAPEVVRDPAAATCDVYLTFPGSSYAGADDVAPWVRAGHGLVQVGDWGPGLQTNAYEQVESCSPRSVVVLDAAHPIAAGVPEAWFSCGTWSNDGDVVEDYVGWVTDADPALARVGGHDRALSAREEGAGRTVFIGWGVYGRAARPEDLVILGNAVAWAGRCGVPAPADAAVDRGQGSR